jgi:ribosomal small subunit protein bTHX
MGKGDKKTKRGKITIGSYGVKRKRKKDRKFVAPKVAEKPKVKVEEEEKPVKKAAPKAEATKKPAAKKPAAKKTTAKKAVPKKEETAVIKEPVKAVVKVEKEEDKTEKKETAKKTSTAKKTTAAKKPAAPKKAVPKKTATKKKEE